MFSLIDQLTVAGACAAEHARAAQEASDRKAAWQADARKKQWESRRNKGNSDLYCEICDRLPDAANSALTLPEVKALFADRDIEPTGISSALSDLVKKHRISRIGKRLNYRYFNPQKEAA